MSLREGALEEDKANVAASSKKPNENQWTVVKRKAREIKLARRVCIVPSVF